MLSSHNDFNRQQASRIQDDVEDTNWSSRVLAVAVAERTYAIEAGDTHGTKLATLGSESQSWHNTSVSAQSTAANSAANAVRTFTVNTTSADTTHSQSVRTALLDLETSHSSDRGDYLSALASQSADSESATGSAMESYNTSLIGSQAILADAVASAANTLTTAIAATDRELIEEQSASARTLEESEADALKTYETALAQAAQDRSDAEVPALKAHANAVWPAWASQRTSALSAWATFWDAAVTAQETFEKSVAGAGHTATTALIAPTQAYATTVSSAQNAAESAYHQSKRDRIHYWRDHLLTELGGRDKTEFATTSAITTAMLTPLSVQAAQYAVDGVTLAAQAVYYVALHDAVETVRAIGRGDWSAAAFHGGMTLLTYGTGGTAGLLTASGRALARGAVRMATRGAAKAGQAAARSGALLRGAAAGSRQALNLGARGAVTRGNRLLPSLGNRVRPLPVGGHNAGRRAAFDGCFVAGTLVLTTSGLMPIEDVQAGQTVWAYDHEAEVWQADTVEATHEHEVEMDLVTVTLEYDDGSRETIEATGNHPFWVESGEGLASRPLAIEDAGVEDATYTSPSGGRYVEARDLSLGDQLLSHEFKSATVIGLQVRTERERVYNLTVERLRNYAVGEAGVLVHNTLCGPQQLVGVTVSAQPRNHVIRVNALNGRAAEMQVANELRRKGVNVVGVRVNARTPPGRREMDIVVRSRQGNFYAIEVKSGSAVRNAGQIRKDVHINRTGTAEMFGKEAWKRQVAGETVKKTFVVHWNTLFP